MYLFVMLLISDTHGSKLIEYKFGENFGEAFYDYSLNKRRGVNGESSVTTTHNTIATDRGAFFQLANGMISLPPNDLETSFSLSSIFSVAFWVINEDNSYYALKCKSTNMNFYIKRLFVNQQAEVRVNINTFDSGVVIGPANGFPFGSWALILLTVDTQMTLTINKSQQISISLPTSILQESLEGFWLGYRDGHLNFQVIMWNFLITNTISSYSDFLSSSSSNCLVQGCSSCSNSIISGQTSGCLSTNMNPFQNSLNEDCDCESGCNSELCLICNKCQQKTCHVYDSNIYCKCPEGSATSELTCDCGYHYYYTGVFCDKCIQDCLYCSDSSSCDSCISSNAVVSEGGCKCKQGFYNNSALIKVDSCKPCLTGCTICVENGKCVKCYDPNADPSLDCACSSGFYFDKKCVPCYNECKECSDYGKCTSCVANNAIPTTFGCACIEGYGSENFLTRADSCVKCSEECETCRTETVCDSCKALYSVPSDSGCVCADGYYLFDSACTPCPIDCKSCDQTKCFSCWSEKAIPIDYNCECPDGTYKISNPGFFIDCEPCLEDCKTCSDKNTCIECLIEGAVKKSVGCACRDQYIVKSDKCVLCETWNTEKRNCEFCLENQYFLNNYCHYCENLCKKCNKDTCLECVENAVLVGNKCECSAMYQGYESCYLKDFYADYKVISDEQIIIFFTLNLTNPLKLEQMMVNIPDSEYELAINKINSRTFMLNIKYISKSKDAQICKITLASSISSIFNHSLPLTIISYEISGSTDGKVSLALAKLSDAVKSMAVSVVSVSIFLSIINSSFVSLWNFLNSVQILIYIRLMNIKMTPKLEAILKALKDTTKILNLFDYFIKEKEFKKLSGHFYSFGFRTSSLLLNAGHLVTVFLIILCNMILVYTLTFLTRFRFCSFGFIISTLESMRNNFRYNTFLRYFIQSYLDYGIVSFVAVISYSVENVAELANYIISLVLVIFVVLTPFAALWFVYNHKDEVSENGQVLMQKYGSLFYEFSNDKGLSSSLFYVLFFGKRLLYMIILFVLEDYFIFQICFFFIVNFSFAAYLYFSMPYSEKIINYANLATELIISFMFILFFIVEMNISPRIDDNVDDLFVTCCYTILIIQTLSPIIILIRNIKRKISESRNKKKVHPETPQAKMTEDIVQDESLKPEEPKLAWDPKK